MLPVQPSIKTFTHAAVTLLSGLLVTQSVAQTPVQISARQQGQQLQIRWNTIPGRYYSLYYTRDLAEPWRKWPIPSPLQPPMQPFPVQANGTSLLQVVGMVAGQQCFRVEELEITPVENMVRIPAGTFFMGRPEDQTVGAEFHLGPETEVSLTDWFWMGKYEVTQEEFRSVMGYNPSVWRFAARLPVDSVSWARAIAYGHALTTRELQAGRIPSTYEYRLPTEAEWEYACRANNTTRFSFGDDASAEVLGQYAYYYAPGISSDGGPSPVGQFLPNPWGLHDMYGNMWEWCEDRLTNPLPSGSVVNLQGTIPSGNVLDPWPIMRGGSYASWLEWWRPVMRHSYNPAGDNHLSFRIVLAPVRP